MEENIQNNKPVSTLNQNLPTVLVVEDDIALNRLIRITLEREGFKTNGFINGAEALSAARIIRDAIMVLDYRLPDMDAKQIITALREEKIETPIIITTGNGDEKIAVELMKMGARDYIVKEPDFFDKLPRIIQQTMETVAMGKDLERAAQKWRTTFDGISDLICLLDKEKRVLQCNRAMSGFLDKPFDKILGKTCCELFHGAAEPVEACPYQRMKETLKQESIDCEFGNRWYHIQTDPILDDTGNLSGAVHIVKDITERKRMEEDLRQSEARLSNPLRAGGGHHTSTGDHA